jgi:hypothetical protein
LSERGPIVIPDLGDMNHSTALERTILRQRIPNYKDDVCSPPFPLWSISYAPRISSPLSPAASNLSNMAQRQSESECPQQSQANLTCLPTEILREILRGCAIEYYNQHQEACIKSITYQPGSNGPAEIKLTQVDLTEASDSIGKQAAGRDPQGCGKRRSTL